ITTILWNDCAHLAVIGKLLQGALRHRVNRERCRQCLNIEDVRGFGIFGSRAGEQESLWAGAGVEDALPTRRGDQVAVSFVRALSNGDTKLVVERVRRLAHDSRVPAADE